MAFYALIMAGGVGTRLWPLSRRGRPKQVLPLIGDQTMFQQAVDRIEPVFSLEQIYVVAGSDYVEMLSEQAPELPRQNFIVEPEGRGTAPCIGLSAIHLGKENEDAVMAVLTADHFIAKQNRFRRALQAARQVAEQGPLVTLGIKPSSPSTGYGYIEQGEQIDTVDGFSVYRADRFTEKPDEATAQRMVESGRYSWNSGMFIWRVDRIIEEFKRQMPDFYARLVEINASLGTEVYEETLSRIWPQINKQTIDYGVMEGAEDVAVIPVDIGWSDVGSWSSLAELLPKDEDGNALVGRHMGSETEDTLVFGQDRLIATIGVEDLVIVDTEDAVLICSKEKAQGVRALVKRLKEEGKEEYL